MGCGITSPANKNFHDKIKRGIKMKSFNFDNMSLESLKMLDNHPQEIVTVFSANNNKIKNLPINFFKKIQKINKLDLSNNCFLEIDEVVFEKITLVNINYSFNNLSFIPNNLKNLINLKELNLSNNFIYGQNLLTEQDSKSLINLQKIDFSSNKIEIFPTNFFYCPSLETILINNNNISEIIFSDWYKTVLKNLDLGQNKFITISSSLLKYSKISNLNLKDNFIKKSDFLKLDGYEEFEKRRKERKDQGFLNNLDISFGICGLD